MQPVGNNQIPLDKDSLINSSTQRKSIFEQKTTTGSMQINDQPHHQNYHN